MVDFKRDFKAVALETALSRMSAKDAKEHVDGLNLAELSPEELQVVTAFKETKRTAGRLKGVWLRDVAIKNAFDRHLEDAPSKRAAIRRTGVQFGIGSESGVTKALERYDALPADLKVKNEKIGKFLSS